MGYSASSFVYVGVPIHAGKLFSLQKDKAFPHDHPETMNFCPTTGKKLWSNCYVTLDGEEAASCSLEDLEIIPFHHSCEASNPNSIFIVGLGKGGLSSNQEGASTKIEHINRWSELQIAEAKEKVKKTLSKYNLWDESKFGIYPILYEGC